MKISIDTPLCEITLRRYEKPYNLNRRELIRKLCLSVGLLQPGDSRDVVVDVLHIMLEAKTEQRLLSSEDVTARVIEIRKKENLPLKGVAGSNIRRQLKRLRELHLVEKVKNNYRILEFSNVKIVFEDKIMRYMLPSIIERVREYCNKVDEIFDNHKNKEIVIDGQAKSSNQNLINI
jgi:hypothetical protein